MPICKIVYLKQSGKAGWRWQSLASDGAARASKQSYELFYDCVVAARASGFAPFPALKCC